MAVKMLRKRFAFLFIHIYLQQLKGIQVLNWVCEKGTINFISRWYKKRGTFSVKNGI